MAEPLRWIPVTESLPKCSRKHWSIGTPVLVWPMNPNGNTEVDGHAYYGRRISENPCFYKYGTSLSGVTHWMPMPGGPND